VCQAHEVVVAFHDVPLPGEGVLVEVALVFLDQEGAFDAPAVAGGEVAVGMHIEPMEGAAGDPGVFVLFGHDLLGFRIVFFPLLPAHHDVDVDGLLGVGSEVVADPVDPLEALSSLAPVLFFSVFFLVVLSAEQTRG